MASLYKKPVVITDPRTGKRGKTKSKKWWGRYRDGLGIERRVPLARDKTAAHAMLNEMVLKAERQAAGQVDPFEEHAKRPLKEHVDAFQQHLRHKANSAQHVYEVATKVRRIVAGCKWAYIRDLSVSRVQKYLAELRQGTDKEEGLSIQTSNHYLRAIKQFSRWLVRDRRTNDDPLVHLAMLNVKVDRRHDRRALSADEFARLAEAAASGPPVVCIPGPDRAIMYVLSAWTGYRKAEIGRLTKRSLRLDDEPPTVTVAACYSKRKRQDTQVLHPEVAKRLREWLIKAKKDHSPDDLFFPVSAKVPGGTERRTSKMMRIDLKVAKAKWVKEASTPEEQEERRTSGLLEYQDEDGLFADFHSNRHTFITNLERAGVSPRTAQSLARHSDIRLTMGVYTHIGLHDQTTAIESLPAPPSLDPRKPSEAAELRATGTDDAQPGARKVPTVVPRGAKNGAGRLAPNTYGVAPDCTGDGPRRTKRMRKEGRPNSLTAGTLRTNLHRVASPCIVITDEAESVHPTGIEPVTFGSVEQRYFETLPCFVGVCASPCIQFVVGFGLNWIQSIGYLASLRPRTPRGEDHAQALASTAEGTGDEARAVVVCPPEVLEEVSQRGGQVSQAPELGRGLRSGGA